MEEMGIKGITSAKLLRDTLRNTHIENPDQKQDDWLWYVRNSLHYVLSNFDLKPSENMEKEFYEWIERMDCDDRNKITRPLVDWLELCESRSKESRKDKEKARDLEEWGNKFFIEKNYENSVERYTDSARYATSDCGDFSRAIANRSAAFFEIFKYEESLRDIELAIKTGYPEEKLWTLHERAAQCHLKLGQSKLAEDSLAKLRKIAERSGEITQATKETILKRAKDLLFAVGESKAKNDDLEPSSTTKTQPVPEDMLEANSTYPYASRAVVCKRSSTRGRHVVAAQPIKKGDVLFAEKSFVWALHTDGDNLSRCAHCCGPMNDALVPCRGCIDTSYCNSICWDNAWSYHQWECPGYRLAIGQQIRKNELGLRIFLTSLATTDKVWFNDLQNLVTNADIMSTITFVQSAVISLQWITYLERYTNFFDTVDLKECHIDKFTDARMMFDFDITTMTGKKWYAGWMILRNTLQMRFNEYEIKWLDDTDGPQGPDIFGVGTKRIGVGMFPSISMLCHSCDPTTKQSSWNNWMIIKAVKDIRQGEDISISYDPVCRQMTKDKRKIWLREGWCFDCQCSACANPLFDNYAERFECLQCPRCSGPSKRLADSDSHRCFDCGTIGKVTCDNALKEATELYRKGANLSDINKWHEAIGCFTKCLTIREKHLYRHNEDVALTLSALKTAYAKIGDWRKSISYLERTIAALEERYESDSIEVAKQLNDTTHILFEFMQIHGPLLGPRSQEQRDLLLKTRECAERALAIVSLICGPWTDRYRTLNDTREQLFVMAEKLEI